MKNVIKFLTRVIIDLLYRSPKGVRIVDEIILRIVNRVSDVNHNHVHMKIHSPNTLCNYRAQSFSTKEPDTIDWLDALDENSVFYDIGANIGLYSIYAAKKGCRSVYSFEPSFFNLEFFVRNIVDNNVQDRVVILPIALSNFNGINYLRLTNNGWGGALSTFSESYNQNGLPLNAQCEYQLCGATLDDICERYTLPRPTHIKIDVDGIEHLILDGALNVFSSVKSVMIEVDDTFVQQHSNVTKFMLDRGFYLFRKTNLGDGNQFNQWWIRSEYNK